MGCEMWYKVIQKDYQDKNLAIKICIGVNKGKEFERYGWTDN